MRLTCVWEKLQLQIKMSQLTKVSHAKNQTVITLYFLMVLQHIFDEKISSLHLKYYSVWKLSQYHCSVMIFAKDYPFMRSLNLIYIASGLHCILYLYRGYKHYFKLTKLHTRLMVTIVVLMICCILFSTTLAFGLSTVVSFVWMAFLVANSPLLNYSSRNLMLWSCWYILYCLGYWRIHSSSNTPASV